MHPSALLSSAQENESQHSEPPVSKTRKFYQSRLMLRAGPFRKLIRTPFAAIELAEDGARVIAHTDLCAIVRDGVGWPKAFALATAGIEPHRLAVYAVDPEHALSVLNTLNRASQSVSLGGPLPTLEAFHLD